MMEAVGSSRMLITICQATWHHNLEDNNIHSYRHENLTSHMIHVPAYTYAIASNKTINNTF
jgi:hypothetical protein